jgi:hypothetical protein
MSWLSDFLNTSLLHSHHARQRSLHLVAPSAAWATIASGITFLLSQLIPSAGLSLQCPIYPVPATSFFVVLMVSSLLMSVNWM